MHKKIIRRSPGNSESLSPALHPVIRRLYAARGVHQAEEADLALKGLLPPDGLKGMATAVDLLAAALRDKRRLLVVGDFDADGATSCALAVLALRAMGAASVDYLVPDRFRYGYGLTPEIVEVARERRPDVLITVDNGISSLEGVRAARDAGCQVLITDHHLPGRELPEADAIVNPNQPGCDFPAKGTAGVGVIFYVMSALRARLRATGWFAEQGRVEPSMAEFLDLVALGTVADVVPLERNNRILVHQGLLRIRAGRCRPGIRALVEIARRSLPRLTATDLGFALGPRLNAAGRLDDMSHGIECLLAEDAARATTLVQELDALNRERRDIEQVMQHEATAALRQLSVDTRQLPWGLSLYRPEWHQGVIGILASRLKERYNRPAIVFAKSDAVPGELKGSARSIPGIHIRDVLDTLAARYPGLITRFGGHAMAAGLSLEATRFRAFADAFDLEIRKHLSEQDLQGVVVTDGELAAEDLTLGLANELRNAGPWGQGFPEPVFDGAFELLDQRLVAEKHLKMTLGLPGTNRVMDAIAFNVDLEAWPNRNASRVAIAYKLDVNEYRGVQSAQLLVDYLRADA